MCAEPIGGYRTIKEAWDDNQFDDPSSCYRVMATALAGVGAVGGMAIGAYLLQMYECSAENEGCVLRQAMWVMPVILGIATMVAVDEFRLLCCRTMRVVSTVFNG